MVDPTAERIDVELGNGFSLAITGREGTFGVRVLREDRWGRRTYITAPTALSEADVVCLGSVLNAFARNHKAATPWFPEDEELQGKDLLTTAVSILA